MCGRSSTRTAAACGHGRDALAAAWRARQWWDGGSGGSDAVGSSVASAGTGSVRLRSIPIAADAHAAKTRGARLSASVACSRRREQGCLPPLTGGAGAHGPRRVPPARVLAIWQPRSGLVSCYSTRQTWRLLSLRAAAASPLYRSEPQDSCQPHRGGGQCSCCRSFGSDAASIGCIGGELCCTQDVAGLWACSSHSASAVSCAFGFLTCRCPDCQAAAGSAAPINLVRSAPPAGGGARCKVLHRCLKA